MLRAGAPSLRGGGQRRLRGARRGAQGARAPLARERAQAAAELAGAAWRRAHRSPRLAGGGAGPRRAGAGGGRSARRRAGRRPARSDALLSQPDLEGPFRVYHLMGRLQAAGRRRGGRAGRAAARAARLARRADPAGAAGPRQAFLSVRRRGEVLAAVEPELRLPRALARPAPVERGSRPGRPLGARCSASCKQLEPIGRSNATVLIRGESGTGKELLAEAHPRSARRRRTCRW